MENHPIKQKRHYHAYGVPLRIFGDGVAVLGLAKSWGRFVECLTLSSYLNQGDSRLATIIMTLLWKAKGLASTMAKTWKILRWSLEALFTGTYPDRNYDGSVWPEGSWHGEMANKPLASGFFGVVVAALLVAT